MANYINNGMNKIIIQKAIEGTDFKAVGGFTLVVLSIFAIGFIADIAAEKENRTVNIDKQLIQMDLTIMEGLTECSELQSDNCIAVMSTLDQICQSIYSPYCFGDLWSEFVEYKQELIDSGSLPEYEEDSYYNLNNDHFGNSSIN